MIDTTGLTDKQLEALRELLRGGYRPATKLGVADLRTLKGLRKRGLVKAANTGRKGSPRETLLWVLTKEGHVFTSEKFAGDME